MSKVFVHVGSPKTGTTFLQNVLWGQRETAAAQGLLLPGERFADHYLASLDVRGLAGREAHPPRSVGSWQRMVDQALAHRGSVLISHELFAAATAEQARAALAPLIDGGAEVHLVLTARDLERQLTAEWQEHVKHRATATFSEFIDGLRADTERRTWFWKVQDFAGVVDRWGAGLPGDRIHVVTVPPKGTDPSVLWNRFAGVLGLDPGAFDLDIGRANASLGMEAAELLRRVNVELGDRLPLPGPYPTIVKNILAHRVLEPHPGTKLRLDADDARFARQQSRLIAERLDGMDIEIVGDLAELVPAEPAQPAQPAQPAEDAAAAPETSAEALLDESVAALADLLVIMNQRARRQRAGEDLAQTAREKPIRFALVQASQSRPALRRLRSGYSRLRGLAKRGG